MKRNTLTTVSSVLLASTLLSVLSACSSPSNARFDTSPASRLRAQNAASVQSDLSRYSMGEAKHIIAAQNPASVTTSARKGPDFKTPDWVRDAVFYQIFPERFHNGNTANDPQGTEPWGSKPKLFNYMGGDLEGVIQKMDYLKDLGVNAIYFNPIFTAPTSNHKYDTANYMEVDPAFGDMETFRRLVKKAHSMGIKVVLDAVFNHSGATHWAFQDAIKNGPSSKYWSWYLIHGFPVIQDPKPNYESWWGFASLPKFNEYNPEVREHLFKVAEFWAKEGIDGWRLDVPNEIRDMNFWREFRQRVKRVNPDLYIVGEIWGDGSPWLQGDQFDAVMNYPFREQVFNFMVEEKGNVDQFDWGLEGLRNQHPDSVTYTMFNVLGSHDTPRVMTMAKNDVNKVKLSALFQMTYVGTPVIYYGDEIGMRGEMDPDCRGAFPWNTAQWDQNLRNYYKQLIALRNQYPALRRGSYRSLMRHNNNRTFAYLREDSRDKIMVVMNNDTRPQDLAIETGRLNVPDGLLTDLMDGQTFRVQGGQALFTAMAPKTGRVLRWSAR